jgi:hypothetical protein
MVILIETIDGIARRLGRDVIYLSFHDDHGDPLEEHPELGKVTDWLDEQGIGWQVCSCFSEGAITVEGGPGCLYLDVPFEPGTEKMSKLEAHLMDKDGQPSLPGFVPTILKLEDAMRNAYQDDPDFF